MTMLRALAPVLLLLAVAQSAGAHVSPCPGSGAAQWITLGTAGGPLPRLRRSQPANALVVNGALYLFDTGNGVLRQMKAAGLPVGNLRAIFITHHHIDHNADLGAVLVNRWVLQQHTAIPVWGPRGTKPMVRNIFSANLATEMAPITAGPVGPALAITATGRDIPADTTDPILIFRDENIAVTAVANSHYHFKPGSAAERFARSYAYRIEAAGRVIVLTGDTGPSAAVTKIAQGADLLVSEVIDLPGVRRTMESLPNIAPTFVDALMTHMRRDHLTPEDVGRMAKTAGVRCVVLTHIAPGLDGDSNVAVYRDGTASIFSGPVIVASDLERF